MRPAPCSARDAVARPRGARARSASSTVFQRSAARRRRRAPAPRSITCGDRGEAQPAVEERCHRDLVGGVEHRRRACRPRAAPRRPAPGRESAAGPGARRSACRSPHRSSGATPDSMRSGKASACAIGVRMSGLPSCAITEPSTYSTIEWTTLCGWITTSICSGRASNSQCASITSSPLFIMVAESTEILRPITQLGCAQACSGVTCGRRSSGVARNGPPEAVSRMRRTPARCRSPSKPRGRHWKIALCSLSIGSSVAPLLAHRVHEQRPGHHQRFLVGEQHALAGARRGQRRRAGRRRRRSPPSPCRTSGSAATCSSACAPDSTSVRQPGVAQRRRSAGVRAQARTSPR